MSAPLNFGPSEQTRAQRQAIAARALAITLAEEKQAAADLRALYDRYIEGEVDLYAISVHVSERTKQQLQALVAAEEARS